MLVVYNLHLLLCIGAALSLTGVGAVVGIPIAITGATVGGIGGLAVGGSIIGEAIAKNKKLEGANKHLQEDYFHSMQIRILIGRAARDEKYARYIGLPLQDAFSMLALLGRFAKFGTATASVVRAAAVGVIRGAGTAGLHIAGMVIAAALIPIDITQMVMSSMKIHNKTKSEVVKDMEKLAANLENELYALLREKNYIVTELERFDSEAIKHWMLVAVETGDINNAMTKSNLSIEDIEKTYVLIYQSEQPINGAVYEKIFQVWLNKEEGVNNGIEEASTNDIEGVSHDDDIYD